MIVCILRCFPVYSLYETVLKISPVLQFLTIWRPCIIFSKYTVNFNKDWNSIKYSKFFIKTKQIKIEKLKFSYQAAFLFSEYVYPLQSQQSFLGTTSSAFARLFHSLWPDFIPDGLNSFLAFFLSFFSKYKNF